MIVTVAKAFVRRGWQEALSYRLAFMLQALALLFSLASFFFMARFINPSRSPLLAPYGGDYLAFGLVGIILLNLQHTAVSAYAQCIRTAQVAGTLEAMLATPAPSWMILLCAPLFQFLTAFVWAVAYLAIGGLCFGLRFTSVNLCSLALAFPLCMLAFASIGFLGAALTMLLRRTDPLSFALGAISALLGGVLYPTSVLPEALQRIGRVLPLTHALEIVRRATFAGATVQELAPSLLGLAAFCAMVAPLGLYAFGVTLRRARRDGSLTHY